MELNTVILVNGVNKSKTSAECYKIEYRWILWKKCF